MFPPYEHPQDIQNRKDLYIQGVCSPIIKIYFSTIILSDIFGVKAYPAINKKRWGMGLLPHKCGALGQRPP